MNHKERMLAGLPYLAALDGLREERLKCKKLIYRFNNLEPDRREEAVSLIKELFGSTGQRVSVGTPFHCDYGWNIFVGENFSANYNLTILDVGKVTIGSNVMFGPNVSIFTAGHPIHPETRASKYEYGIPVTIGDNVWVGGCSVILPGVTIGNNVVIGAGSVVTKDIPDNVVAVGNHCRVTKNITEEDKRFYYKDRLFDDDAWADVNRILSMYIDE